MKTLLHLHAHIYLFLLALTTTATLAQVVFDSDGEPIRNGGRLYYILPVMRGKGGGLELAKTGSQTCPLTVVQSPFEVSKGLPARFSTPVQILEIPTFLTLHIEFLPHDPSTCLPWPSRWTVEKESLAVKIAKGGQSRIIGPFRIQTVNGEGNYKLQYCYEYDSDSSEDECKDLGISIDGDDNRRLVVKHGDPLVVQFVKAASSDDSVGIRRSIV